MPVGRFPRAPALTWTNLDRHPNIVRAHWVEEIAGRLYIVLESDRGLVLLETRNDVTTLVGYLAAMAAGHVVLPVDARRDHSAILQTGPRSDERGDASPHVLF